MTLKELERKIEQIRPQRLIVLARTQDGAEKEMGIDELIETKGEFIRVLRGNDLSDVDALLRYEVPDCVIEQNEAGATYIGGSCFPLCFPFTACRGLPNISTDCYKTVAAQDLQRYISALFSCLQ